MNELQVFEGKSIDDAIDTACTHFATDRAQLEVEIVSDSKGGIFGLVGARKAKIKARVRDNNESLKQMVAEVVENLIKPIVPSPNLEVSAEGDSRIKVTVNDEENSGLLIGREGQTLASLQYLANRIVSKKWPDPVRVQIDTGEYRERQDDNLRQLALHLADKAKKLGRVQSTRPLSSYHRRVVHMALQPDEGISTRSKGDGTLKRVLIMPKSARSAGRRGGHQQRAPQQREMQRD